MCKINFRPLDSLLGEVERLFQRYFLQTFDLSEVRKTLKCYISTNI